MSEKHPVPKLDTSQMLACAPGLPLETFAQWVKRGLVTLPDRGGKGQGYKRFYSPHEVLQVAAIYEITRHGFPPREAKLLWLLHMQARIVARQFPIPGDTPDMALLLSRNPSTGELVVGQIREGEDNSALFSQAKAPDTYTVFRIDRFIDRVVRRIEAVIAGKPPELAPNPERDADPDPMLHFGTDSDGRKIMVGLTYHETLELEALMERRAPYPEDYDFDAADDRRQELYARHENARFARILAQAKAREKGEKE